ncbi:hypothetical protein [Halocatena pleomorpha]|uniref:DNA replication complex GINS family protein n=1 Tax=Halocatena pleomorpha TaxID=1785090 RepID=A0A3P3R397_9EURY|nr:hypothetical protein [Halocatena pleomorpha]RRJ27825.1 hypothetical protein EIK79_17235 [Halocatena pleomorpha]
MNLDELQSVQSRERQIDSLQQLHDTFYEDAGRFIRQLREEREQVAAAADDPFDSTDVQRLTDEIDTAERTVEAIYERRIGKLVKQASLEAAGMAADVEGLTREERSAFDSLVSTIESNRTRVLDEVLANAPAERDSDTASTDPESNPELKSETTPSGGSSSDEVSPPPDRELAAEAPDRDAAVADTSVDASSGGSTPETTADADNSVAIASDPRPPPETTSEDTGDVPVHTQPAADSPDASVNASPSKHPDVDRVTVRITNDVGEILCVDDRAYELSTDDIVTLPKPNAQPLIDHDAATRLEER